PGADRLAPLGLSVLTGIAVEGADGGDALRRRPLGGVDHQQLLPDPVVDRVAVRLEDEDVGAADALAVPAVDLAVGDGRQDALAGGALEVLGALLAQLFVAPAGEEHQLLLGPPLHRRRLPRYRRSSRSASRSSSQPSVICAGTPFAIARGGTSRVTTAPAPVYASSPISTGATRTVLDEIRAFFPTLVRCFSRPS